MIRWLINLLLLAVVCIGLYWLWLASTGRSWQVPGLGGGGGGDGVMSRGFGKAICGAWGGC